MRDRRMPADTNDLDPTAERRSKLLTRANGRKGGVYKALAPSFTVQALLKLLI